ncbi:MAG: bifunctional phosphopantothenoylcysteine decarboxylase/phosphopantothenate--cysteine ligase CoaBC [Xanthobacteraceae bacterium]
MASITIRQLDDGLKQRLRLRAASNGRSMEDEARHILGSAASAHHAGSRNRGPVSLREAAATRPVGSATTAQVSAGGAEEGARILLIISGGVAAYKSLDLIRRLKERRLAVRCILTSAAQQFITPLAAAALSGERVFTDLFDPASELDVGHIRLAREADLVIVAPATADLIAKMAGGHADDLATAALLATRRRILLAPAMNPDMWQHAATQRNLARLAEDGILLVGPGTGEMAEAGEAGVGRMAEPLEIVAAALPLLQNEHHPLPLAGKRLLVTSGPTHEPIDPVRYIANRSSGKQGHAIAAAAALAGAQVTLITGPVTLADPVAVKTIKVETAEEMLAAVTRALPVDAAVFAAAVADWRVSRANTDKIKKETGTVTRLDLKENPDILASVAQRTRGRPRLVIGFAAETEHLLEHAKRKLERKGCDWIVANDVSAESGVMGGDRNTVHLVTPAGVESWPPQSKDEVARALIARIAASLQGSTA